MDYVLHDEMPDKPVSLSHSTELLRARVSVPGAEYERSADWIVCSGLGTWKIRSYFNMKMEFRKEEGKSTLHLGQVPCSLCIGEVVMACR